MVIDNTIAILSLSRQIDTLRADTLGHLADQGRFIVIALVKLECCDNFGRSNTETFSLELKYRCGTPLNLLGNWYLLSNPPHHSLLLGGARAFVKGE